MTDPARARHRYQLPCASHLYAALVLGFSIGLVYFDYDADALPNVARAASLGSIPDLRWDAPVPLRVVNAPLKHLSRIPRDEDAILLNWPPHRCHCSSDGDCPLDTNTACAYMNATSATHSTFVVERWTRALSRRNVTLTVTATYTNFR